MNTANIICGIKGLGKSSYSKKKWPTYFFIECDIPVSSKTYAIIKQAVYKGNNSLFITTEQLVLDFYEILKNKDGIVVDNTEMIDTDTLKFIVNVSKQKNIKLVFVFDLPYKKLHTSNAFLSLLEWDLIKINDDFEDFKVDINDIKEFFSKKHPYIQASEFDKIINVTGFNFNEIKKLLWINKINSVNGKSFTEKAINLYLKEWLEKNLVNISSELTDVLKKASVIGVIFDKRPLEHKNGFNILGVSNYLDELVNEEIFISKYLPKKDCFNFINDDIYNAVVSSLSALQKNEWHNILKEYYIKVFVLYDDYLKIEALIQAKRSANIIKDFQAIFEINQVLLSEYINSSDLKKALTIIDEIIDDTYISKDRVYIDYLSSLKIQILIDFGEYKEALKIVKNNIKDNHYTGSEDYLKYYYIKCLYCCGFVDQAYYEIEQLIKHLKRTSKAGASMQKLYPLTYSMMSSIQNHLGIDDNGSRYYILALNHARNSINDESLYYDILSKYDMFFSGSVACNELMRCANFFQKNNDKLKLGKTHLNLATEMMFEGYGSDCDVEKYLISAKRNFIFPDENLAYTKNNLAIFYILTKNDFSSAIQELESSLFVNLSDFTYMTIYLNLLMCYFIVDGRNSERFKNAYQQFIKHQENIENRKNSTKYEAMYRAICELIVSDEPKNNIICTCNKYLSQMQCSDFFYPIFQDIKNRVSGIREKVEYKNNCNFYKGINEKGIFLAEFRFWE